MPALRVLVVTNMHPSPRAPALGAFVRDQVRALRAHGVDIELFSFPPGGSSYLRAAHAVRSRYRGERFDVIHAHFGLTLWPALAVRGAPHVVTLHGTDLRHPRSARITRAGLRFADLPATVSASLAELLPGAGTSRRVAVLPCGVDIERFRPLPRSEARGKLGLDPDAPLLLFPADPARTVKGFEHAQEVAGETPLLTLGSVEPEKVPLWFNAVNAVLVPSHAEGFGLAPLEALACDVPVLATPVGIAPVALDGIAGTLCAPYDREVWAAALVPPLQAADPRVEGRRRALMFSAQRMAERVALAYASVAS